MTTSEDIIKQIEEEKFIEESAIAVSVFSILEEYPIDMINEGKIQDILDKFNIKKETGLVEYLYKFTKGAGLFVYYAIKKDKAKIKELSKEYSREDFVKFLEKLNLGIFHFLLEPLHLVYAVTGWNPIEQVISTIKKSETIASEIKNYLDKVTDLSGKFGTKIKKRVKTHVNKISIATGV